MSDSIITAVSHFYRATEEKHRGYFVLHFCKGNVEGNYFHVQAARILRAKLKICSSCQSLLTALFRFSTFCRAIVPTVCGYKLYQEYNKVKQKVHEFTVYTVSQPCTKDRSGKNLVLFHFSLDISSFLGQTPTVTFPFCFSLVLLHQFFIQGQAAIKVVNCSCNLIRVSKSSKFSEQW